MTSDFLGVQNQVPSVHLVPTFPLDEMRIRRLRYRAILTRPRLLVARCAAAFAALAPLSTASRTNGIRATAVSTWKELDRELVLEIVRTLIDESNREQDESIQQMILQLKRSGNLEYGITLGKFLLLKQRVERELHMDGPVTDRKQEIEKLVDSVCLEVCHEMSRLSGAKTRLTKALTSGQEQDLEELEKETSAANRRIMTAYSTLSDIASLLLEVGNRRWAKVRHSTATGGENRLEDRHVLDRLLEVLRDEAETHRNVETRLRDELPHVRR